jgi:hypothetical protein
VRLEASRLANDLTVAGVRNACLRDDDDRLVHLVRGYPPLLHAPRAPGRSALAQRTRARALLLVLTQDLGRGELGCSMFSLGKTLLADDGLNLRVRAAHRPDLAEIGQMTRSQRKAQIEELRLRVARLLLQLPDGKIAQSFEILVLFMRPPRARRSSCRSAAWPRRDAALHARPWALRRTARRARAPGGRPRPSPRDSLCPSPCELRPVSS